MEPRVDDREAFAVLGVLRRLDQKTGAARALWDNEFMAYHDQARPHSILSHAIDNVPRDYQRRLDGLWGEWLPAEYGAREALAAAWGDDLDEEEEPVEGTVRRVSVVIPLDGRHGAAYYSVELEG